MRDRLPVQAAEFTVGSSERTSLSNALACSHRLFEHPRGGVHLLFHFGWLGRIHLALDIRFDRRDIALKAAKHSGLPCALPWANAPGR